jgi:N-acetylmuramoyl-L-alanine amidase
MRGYYAFSRWRFKHAVHPMTPAIILETGYLSTPSDAYIISRTPEVPARALADALIKYLKS